MMEVAKTKSEELFEQFCEDSSIRYDRIEEGEVPTPDYEIFLDSKKVIVEVKQTDSNKEDLEEQKKFEKGLMSGGGRKIGEKVRDKIQSASSQIRTYAAGKHPSILVLFNNVFSQNYLEPHDIRAAMYGDYSLLLSRPEDLNIRTKIIGKKFGGGRKMRLDSNTSISAIGVLGCERKELRLYIYENKFATVPLKPHLFTELPVRFFSIDESSMNWEELNARK